MPAARPRGSFGSDAGTCWQLGPSPSLPPSLDMRAHAPPRLPPPRRAGAAYAASAPSAPFSRSTSTTRQARALQGVMEGGRSFAAPAGRHVPGARSSPMPPPHPRAGAAPLPPDGAGTVAPRPPSTLPTHPPPAIPLLDAPLKPAAAACAQRSAPVVPLTRLPLRPSSTRLPPAAGLLLHLALLQQQLLLGAPGVHRAGGHHRRWVVSHACMRARVHLLLMYLTHAFTWPVMGGAVSSRRREPAWGESGGRGGGARVAVEA